MVQYGIVDKARQGKARQGRPSKAQYTFIWYGVASINSNVPLLLLDRLPGALEKGTFVLRQQALSSGFCHVQPGKVSHNTTFCCLISLNRHTRHAIANETA